MLTYVDTLTGAPVPPAVLMAGHIADVTRHYGDYSAYLAGSYNGDAAAALADWVALEVTAGALTPAPAVTLIAASSDGGGDYEQWIETVDDTPARLHFTYGATGEHSAHTLTPCPAYPVGPDTLLMGCVSGAAYYDADSSTLALEAGNGFSYFTVAL